MDNKVMSDSYCEAVAYIIITQAQYLEDKNKAGAFIALFLQSISKKYGETGLKRVVEAIRKELTPEALQKLGYKQDVKNAAGNRAKKQSPFIARLRNKLRKKRQTGTFKQA
ncbi:MAG: hypothetical protein HQK99_06905 [Nitrospirae bacterium]|nr:hypothetical protein [Nitrospirota bacterium]